MAYACASRYGGHYAVTLSVDQVIFREPIHVGELVTFAASVNYTGRTSMEVGIRVTAEDIQTRKVRHTNSCYFTMVAMKDGRPIPVPPVGTENPPQRDPTLAHRQGPQTTPDRDAIADGRAEHEGTRDRGGAEPGHHR